MKKQCAFTPLQLKGKAKETYSFVIKWHFFHLCENTNVYLTFTMLFGCIQVETIIIAIAHININDRKTLNISKPLKYRYIKTVNGSVDACGPSISEPHKNQVTTNCHGLKLNEYDR